METIVLSVDRLDPPVVEMREQLETPEFLELVADIKRRGLLQPIIVRLVDGKYRIVAGYRRWRAAREAGLLEVPCVVRDLDDLGEIELMMAENIHRENPTALEEGKMFAVMHEGLHLTYPGIAEKVGKSVGYVTDRLTAVRGPLDIRQVLAAGEINLSVALQLMRVAHDGDRTYLLYWARTQGASAATVRGWVEERLQTRAREPQAPAPATTPEEGGAPPVAMGLCEWHMGPSPLNGLLSLRVCPLCQAQLNVIRLTLEAEGAKGGEANADVQGP